MISKLQDLKLGLQKGGAVRASAGISEPVDGSFAIPRLSPRGDEVFSNEVVAELDVVLKRRHDQLLNRLDRQEDTLKRVLAATTDIRSEARSWAAKTAAKSHHGARPSLSLQNQIYPQPRRSGVNIGGMQAAMRPRGSIELIAKPGAFSEDASSPKLKEAPIWDSALQEMSKRYGSEQESLQKATPSTSVLATPSMTPGGAVASSIASDTREKPMQAGTQSLALDNGVEGHAPDREPYKQVPEAVDAADTYQPKLSMDMEPPKRREHGSKGSSFSNQSSGILGSVLPARQGNSTRKRTASRDRGMKSSIQTASNKSGFFGDPANKALARLSAGWSSGQFQSRGDVSRKSQWSTDSDEDRLRRSAAQEVQEREFTKEDSTTEGKTWLPGRKFVQSLTASFRFEIFFAVLIITNSVYVGAQVQFNVTYAEDNGGAQHTPVAFYVIGYAYTFGFLVELLLRVYADGPSFFCHRTQWTWNYLDIVIVTSSCLEVVLDIVRLTSDTEDEDESSVGGVANVRILRMLRITRLTRVLRIVRIVRFIRALRTLVYSIISTLKSLVWAMLLLVIIIYVFGILFTQGVSDHLAELGDGKDLASIQCTADQVILKQYYGSLFKSMYTLFKAVAGGISWDVVVEPLGSASPIFVALFTIFIAFVYFAVLNVVTGVFCQSAIESAAHDADMVVHAQLANKKMYVDKVKALFMDIDADNSGFITINEFEKYLLKDEVQAYFVSLDLDITDAWTLFKLLDADESNVVDIEEFVTGCLRLKGGAKAIDMAGMMFEIKSNGRRLGNFMKYVENEFQTFSDMADLIRMITAHSRECPLLLPMMDLAGPVGSILTDSEQECNDEGERRSNMEVDSVNSIQSIHTIHTVHGHGHAHTHSHGDGLGDHQS